ncbi:MAG TPA: hypothetical protein VF622_06635 [Segetibacter sp.]|jgi:hypothetical protein
MRKFFLLVLITLLSSSTIHAQKKIFIRLFSPTGEKFAKGFYGGTTTSSIIIYKSRTDSSKILYKNKERVEIPVSSIGVIKTKRSKGNGALIGYAIGGGTLGILGLVSGESNPEGFEAGRGESFVFGNILGGLTGVAVGSIIQGLKKGYTFKINGSNTLWLEQKSLIDKFPTLQPRTP